MVVDPLGPLARALLILSLGLAVSGCLSSGRPVIDERAAVPQDPPPRTQTDHPPIIPTPGRRAEAASRGTSESSTKVAPAAKRETMPSTYEVRRGDTLYSIAYRYDLDPHGFARANGIRSPYTIYPGQMLQLRSRKAVGGTANTGSASTTVSRPSRAEDAPSSSRAASRWVWPLSQRPSSEFGSGSKGMDFNVSSAQSVKSASAGQVVYAGSGIGGFAKLVIVRHSESLLSAYSFNGEARVQESQRVIAGETLAEVTPRGRAKQVLHFEIRRDGEPVNPRSVIN